MPDIPSILTAQTSSSAATATSTSPALTAVHIALADVSQALQNLTHTIQVNATVTVAPDNNTLTLVTALGSVTVNLAQQIVSADRQNLLQDLLNISLSQKSVALSLQAGSPPTQGVILMPTSPASQIAPVSTNLAPSFTPNASFPPLTTGQTLTAIVLPADILSPTQVPLTTTTGPAAVLQYPLVNQPNMGVPTNQAPSTPPVGISLSQAQILLPPSPTLPAALIPTGALPTALQNTVSAQAPVLAPTSSLLQSTNVEAPSTTASVPPSLQMPVTNVSLQTAGTPVQTVPLPTPEPSTSLPVPSFYSQPTSQTPPTLAALLQAGNEVSLHITTVLPPSQNSLPTQLPPLASNQIVATVVGTGTDGQLILKTANAVLFIKTQVTAQIGSTVIVTVDAVKAAPLMTLPQEPAAFQNLPQAMAALAQLDPLIFQQMMSAHIPQLTDALPGALLLLFSAFKQGNLRDWLGGDATDSLLHGGQANLVASLSRELAGAGQPAQDAVVGQWRAYPIPLYAQQQFQALTLYVHNDRDARRDQASSAAPSGNKVRFLIDMSLSKLGAMQIDGFVQPKKLDMVLRSEALLPEGMHNDLRMAYIKSLGAVGYAGTLHFQVGRQHWMTMRKSASQAIMT